MKWRKEMENKKRGVVKGVLQTTVANLLALLQMYEILAIKIFQQQKKLRYFMRNLVSSPNMQLQKIRRTSVTSHFVIIVTLCNTSCILQNTLHFVITCHNL